MRILNCKDRSTIALNERTPSSRYIKENSFTIIPLGKKKNSVEIVPKDVQVLTACKKV